MRVPFFIVIWFAIFTAWLWIMYRVERQFRYTGRTGTLLSLSFYSAGVAGVLILIGSRKRSPLLARWVEYVIESKPIEQVGGIVLGSKKVTLLRYRVRDFLDGLRRKPRGGDELGIMLDDEEPDITIKDDYADIMIDDDPEDRP